MIHSLARRLKQVLPESAVARLQAYDHWFNGEPELRLVGRLCASTAASVDVGANIGTYTYFMRRRSRTVIAFEPNPQLAARLARLYPDVTVRNVAVSDKSGKVVLSMPRSGEVPMHELGSIAQNFDDDADVIRFDVEAVRLDDEKLPQVGFLKIDAEQHEREVLLGAMDSLRRWRPVIMTETTPLLYPEGLIERFRFLADAGYVGWFTFRGQLLPFDRFEAAQHAAPANFGTPEFLNPNVFFFPRDIDARRMLGL